MSNKEWSLLRAMLMRKNCCFNNKEDIGGKEEDNVGLENLVKNLFWQKI